MGDIDITHKILTENLGYIFIDELSNIGSNKNLFKYKKIYFSGGTYTYQEFSFYGDIKKDKVSSIYIDDSDKEKFQEIKKEMVREESITNLLNE